MARYGDQIPPFREDMPRKPVDPYGLAKAHAEEHLELLNEIHGLNFVTVVPHNVIGVGQRYYDPFRNVVGIMISRCLQKKPSVFRKAFHWFVYEPLATRASNTTFCNQKVLKRT